MALITQQRFLRYQQEFYKKVFSCEMSIEIGIEEPVFGDFISDFTGSNDRVVTWYPFTALYVTEIDSYQRERTGLSHIEGGEIFLSPLQLIPVFNTFKIQEETTLIKKSGHEFIVDRVIYLEPLYESCIGIQIILKDKLRG